MSSNSPSPWSSWVNNKIGQTGPGFASAAAAAPSIAAWLVLEPTEVLRGFMPTEGGVPVSPWWWLRWTHGQAQLQGPFTVRKSFGASGLRWCLVLCRAPRGWVALRGSWGLILGAQRSQHHRDLLRMGAAYSLAGGEAGGLRKAVPSTGEE